MSGFAVRTLIAAMGLWIASAIVPGVEFSGTGTLLLAAALLGLVNAVVRPLVVFFTLPIAILTLAPSSWWSTRPCSVWWRCCSTASAWGASSRRCSAPSS